MSKYRGIWFCDKCFASIPNGEAYHENGKKDKCSKCKKKWNFVRNILAIVVFGLGLGGGIGTYENLDRRVEDNTTAIVATVDYVAGLEVRIERTFYEIGTWGRSVENRLEDMRAKYKKETEILQETISHLRKETNEILAAQKKLQKDLGNGKLAEEQVALAIAMLTQRARDTEEQLSVLLRNPKELIEKVVKPTVGIAVRDRNGDRLRGSGVLFRKEKLVDKKTGLIRYRYYGFTAYHVWESVFKYYERIKKPDRDPIVLPDGRVIVPSKVDRTLNPELLVYYYGGNSTRRTLLITGGEFLYPNKPLHRSWKAIQDITVFTFESTRGDLAIAQLASDAEIKDYVGYGSRIYTTGIAVGSAPSLYFGTVASPKVTNDMGIYFNSFGYFGQSGGPVYDAKTLKVISINQRILVHQGFSPLSNTLFGTLLSDIRRVWSLTAPREHKKLLNP